MNTRDSRTARAKKPERVSDAIVPAALSLTGKERQRNLLSKIGESF
jgi:hypothetical protein